MRSRVAARAVVALCVLAQALSAQADTSLVAPGSRLEKVWCCGVFLEGPAAAPDGTIYFTDVTGSHSDPRYIGDEPIEQPVLGVYRVDPDGSPHLLTADLGKPNGVALSPDEKTLYVASVGKSETAPLPEPVPTRSALEAITAYDLHEDGSLTFRKTLVDFMAPRGKPETNGPDGIDTDTSGNIWATQGNWKAVVVFDPDGNELGRIELPEGAANLEFGRGAEADWLYITGRTGLYRVRVKARGWHAAER